MKMRQLIGFLAACALLALCGCETPILTSTSLADETVTYSSAFFTSTGYVPNGHDTISFTFNSTGRAGTFEEKIYAYGYATQADIDSGLYASSSWYQTGGSTGEFTYNPTTYSFSITVLKMYTLKADASPMTNAAYAADSYEYQDIATVYGDDKAEFTMTTQAAFMADALSPVLCSSSSAWESSASVTMPLIVLGMLFTYESQSTTTVSITESGLGVTTSSVASYTVGDATSTTTTTETSDYGIQKFFLIGQSDPTGLTFANAWKYGNDVSFQLNRTRYTKVQYEGATAPASLAAPTVDAATGYVEATGGTAGTDSWTYVIDERVEPAVMQYAHKGSYVIDLDQDVGAVRGIPPR